VSNQNEENEDVLEALICAVDAAEGAGHFELTRRLRFETAQFVYANKIPITRYEAIARKCGWEWDGKASPLKDIAHSLGLAKSHVQEHCK